MSQTKVKHLKKGDLVVARSGAFKGKSGKVLEVNQGKALVKVEGLGLKKRHTKPGPKNAKGGVVESERFFPASVFAVTTDSKSPIGRAGYEVSKDGEKNRVFRKSGKTVRKD